VVTTTIVVFRLARNSRINVVELTRTDRIETGGRLVEEEDLGSSAIAPRDRRPLPHAATDLGGKKSSKPLSPTKRELEDRDLAISAFG